MALTWRLSSKNSPWGNNYLVFDNYTVGRSNPTLPNYTITPVSSSSTLGSAVGGGQFFGGAAATVTATSGSGGAFIKWTENGVGVGGSSSYTFAASSDRTLVAAFQPTLFSAWRSTRFTASEQANASISGELADPDKDGIPQSHGIRLQP